MVGNEVREGLRNESGDLRRKSKKQHGRKRTIDGFFDVDALRMVRV